MTALALVTTAEPLRIAERLSMSYIQDAARCMRMADLKRKADTAGEDATVGTAVHEVGALAGMRTARLGVDRLSADELERLAMEVIRTPTPPVKPLSKPGKATIIALSRRLARVYDEGPPPFPIGAEYEVYATRPLDGHVISSRIDWRWIDGTICWIKDMKTGGKQADDEETFQGEVYAWETLGTHPWIKEFWLAEHAVPYGGPKWVWMSADDLTGPGSIEEYLSDMIARLEVAYAAGELTPSPGSWCGSMCPDRAGCPLPEFAKGDVRSGTDAEAVATLDRLIVQRARSRDATSALKDRLEATGTTHITSSSGDQEFGYTDGTRCQVRKARSDER